MASFDTFKRGLQNTAQVLSRDIRDLFKSKGRLVDDAFLDELFADMVKTDMGAGPAGEIRDEVKSEFRGRVVEMSELMNRVKSKLKESISQPPPPNHPAE